MFNWNPRRRQNGAEDILKEIVTENFPKIMKEIKAQIQDAMRI